jgi:hypothetical protein
VHGGAVVERERVGDRAFLDQPAERRPSFSLAIVVWATGAGQEAETGQWIET